MLQSQPQQRTTPHLFSKTKFFFRYQAATNLARIIARVYYEMTWKSYPKLAENYKKVYDILYLIQKEIGQAQSSDNFQNVDAACYEYFRGYFMWFKNDLDEIFQHRNKLHGLNVIIFIFRGVFASEFYHLRNNGYHIPENDRIEGLFPTTNLFKKNTRMNTLLKNFKVSLASYSKSRPNGALEILELPLYEIRRLNMAPIHNDQILFQIISRFLHRFFFVDCNDGMLGDLEDRQNELRKDNHQAKFLTNIIRRLCGFGEEKELACFELKKILCIQLAQDLEKLFDAHPKGKTNANNILVQVLTKIHNVINTAFDNNSLLFEKISQDLYDFFIESTRNNPELYTKRTNAFRENNNQATLLGKIFATLLMFGIDNKLNYDKLEAICELTKRLAQQTQQSTKTPALQTSTTLATQTRATPLQQTRRGAATKTKAVTPPQPNSTPLPALKTRAGTPPPQTTSKPSPAEQTSTTPTTKTKAVTPPQPNSTSSPTAPAQQTYATPTPIAPPSQTDKSIIYNINKSEVHFHTSPVQQTPKESVYTLFHHAPPMNFFTPRPDKKLTSSGSDIESQAKKLHTDLVDHKQPLTNDEIRTLVNLIPQIQKKIQNQQNGYAPLSLNPFPKKSP